MSDRLRGALGAWVTSGFDDAAVDEEMYLTDPVYKAVVYQTRGLFVELARKSGNSVAGTRRYMADILSDRMTPTMAENIRRQMLGGWSEDPPLVTPSRETDAEAPG